MWQIDFTISFDSIPRYSQLVIEEWGSLSSPLWQPLSRRCKMTRLPHFLTTTEIQLKHRLETIPNQLSPPYNTFSIIPSWGGSGIIIITRARMQIPVSSFKWGICVDASRDGKYSWVYNICRWEQQQFHCTRFYLVVAAEILSVPFSRVCCVYKVIPNCSYTGLTNFLACGDWIGGLVGVCTSEMGCNLNSCRLRVVVFPGRHSMTETGAARD